jgi:acetyltransferase-like isoleucine patch superfamily enzyme
MKINVQNNGNIHDTVKFLGSGVVIISPGANIRHYSIVEMDNGYLFLGNNAVLGFHSMVQCTGTMSIGDNTMIGPQNTLLASYHRMSSDPAIQRALIRSYLTIKENVWSGANVVFNHGVTVWPNSVIGANSFVNYDIHTNSVFAGTPAKFIKHKDAV